MNKSGSSPYIGSETAHKRFFQWADKWFCKNLLENTSSKPDIPSIICLLQTIGFKLREFDKCDRLIRNKDLTKENTIKITLECGTSKMVAILDMDDIECECQNNNEIKDGSLWSIIGTEPVGSTDSINKIEETGSNLLPKMTKETSIVVRNVVHMLFEIINNKCDINRNTGSDKYLWASCRDNVTMKNIKNRSYTDLYDMNYKLQNITNSNTNLSRTKFNSSINLKKTTIPNIPKLMRQDTFDIDCTTKKMNEVSIPSLKVENSSLNIKEIKNGYNPKLTRQYTYDIDIENENVDEPRSSPSKIPNSPVLPELCNSNIEISLQSDEENWQLAEYIVKAHQILEKAINSVIKKLPINSSNSSFQDDNNFVRPTIPPLMNSSFCVNSPYNRGSNIINHSMSSIGSSRPNSACSMRSKISQPIKTIPVAKKSTTQTNGSTSDLSMRDRSSSCSVVQRPQQLSCRNLNLPSKIGTNRRNSTIGIITTGIAPRTTSIASKLPGSKLVPKKIITNCIEEQKIVTKRRVSSETKSKVCSPTRQRMNASFLKVPSSTSRHSTGSVRNTSSKFGFSAIKK